MALGTHDGSLPSVNNLALSQKSTKEYIVKTNNNNNNENNSDIININNDETVRVPWQGYFKAMQKWDIAKDLFNSKNNHCNNLKQVFKAQIDPIWGKTVWISPRNQHIL